MRDVWLHKRLTCRGFPILLYFSLLFNHYYLNNLHMLDTRIVLANIIYSAGRDEKNSTDLPDNENTQVSRIGIDG